MNERAVSTRPAQSDFPETLPVARGVSFDAMHVHGSRRATDGGVWYDAFALADERIVVSSGEFARSDAATSPALVRQLRAIFHSGGSANQSATLLGTADALLRSRSAEHVSAIVGIIDRAAGTFSYVTAGQVAPYIRYHDGTVCALPGGSAAEADDEDVPASQTVVDLSGAALLLLYTAGLLRATRTISVGSRRLAQVLDDARLLHCASPAAWLARRMLEGRAHPDVALLAVLFSARSEAPSQVRPPHWATSWTFEATAGPSQAVRRAFLRCLTSKSNAGHPVDAAAAELVFGELLGNVARHAPGLVEATLDWTMELPVLHVLDNGVGYTSRRAVERLPVDELREDGRGLFIIDAFTTNFRIREREGGGTHASATLALINQ